MIYAAEPDLGVEAFCRVLVESGLGDGRPLNDLERMGRMLAEADLVVTAHLGSATGALVGVARCITDFCWCCYLSELAVARQAQGLGVGAGLIAAVRAELGPQVSLILASMPEAVGFYERIGMPRLSDAFWYRRDA